MCTHEKLERDNEMLGIGVIEIGEKIKAQTERERERVGS